MSFRIYFMRPQRSIGPVKVGLTGKSALRLAAYQAMSPVPLEIVAELPIRCEQPSRREAQRVERGFHERYFDWHLHHEWFAFNPLIERDIAEIVRGSFGVEILPPPTRRTWRLPLTIEARRAAA